MQNLDPENIESILDNLKDEMSIEPMVHKMFEFKEPQEVKQLIEKLKGTLARKNNELKKLLSNNHQHLFSCTDLIDQLKKFSKSAKINQQKLEKLQNSANTFDSEYNVKMEEIEIPKFEVSEEKGKLWIQNFLSNKEEIYEEDIQLFYIFERFFSDSGNEIFEILVCKIVDQLFEIFCNIGEDNSKTLAQDRDIEGILRSFCLLIFTKKNSQNYELILEDIAFACSENLDSFEISDIKWEKYFENSKNIFQVFINGIEILFTALISSDKWNYDLVKLIKSFRHLETSFGLSLKLTEEDDLGKMNIDFFLRKELKESKDQIKKEKIQGFEGWLGKMRIVVLGVYKEAIKKSVKFGDFFSNEINVVIFKEYQKNLKFINNWEKSLEGKLKESEHLKHVLSSSWEDYCERVISELKTSVSLKKLFGDVFMAEKDEMFKIVENYSKKFLENYQVLEGLHKINQENLDCLKLESKKKSYVENFEDFFFKSYNTFLEEKIEENPNFADDEVLKILTSIIEITEKVKETNFDKGRVKDLEKKSLQLFWKKEENLIHKVKELNRFSEIYNTSENSSKTVLVKGLKLLKEAEGDNSLEISMLNYIEQKSTSVNNLDIVKQLRASCRKIIPFHIIHSEEYHIGKEIDSKLKLKRKTVASLRKVDYLKHILI